MAQIKDERAREGASREEIVEAIKIGVIAGGSVAFPNARFAFGALEETEALGDRPAP